MSEKPSAAAEKKPPEKPGSGGETAKKNVADAQADTSKRVEETVGDAADDVPDPGAGMRWLVHEKHHHRPLKTHVPTKQGAVDFAKVAGVVALPGLALPALAAKKIGYDFAWKKVLSKVPGIGWAGRQIGKIPSAIGETVASAANFVWSIPRMAADLVYNIVLYATRAVYWLLDRSVFQLYRETNRGINKLADLEPGTDLPAASLIAVARGLKFIFADIPKSIKETVQAMFSTHPGWAAAAVITLASAVVAPGAFAVTTGKAIEAVIGLVTSGSSLLQNLATYIGKLAIK